MTATGWDFFFFLKKEWRIAKSNDSLFYLFLVYIYMEISFGVNKRITVKRFFFFFTIEKSTR